MKHIKLQKVVVVRAAFLLAVLFMGILIGIVSTIVYKDARFNNRQKQYSLLADRVVLGSDKDRTVSFTALRQAITDYADTNLKNTDFSIFFEYLPTGTSIGVNESKNLIGASLLKVPFAMQYYRAVEENKISPNDIITLKQTYLDNTYGNLYEKGAGYKLTADELVATMLRDSDNTALRALADTLTDKADLQNVDQIFGFVDLNYENDAEGSTLIGAEAYSSILKCLYFACFISKEHSQDILTLLTQSTFDNRLKRYIPQEGMPVIAHKIGSFGKTTQSDCGIFYEPKKPYVLCVMVNGEDEYASQHIGRLSVIVYEYISSLVQ